LVAARAIAPCTHQLSEIRGVHHAIGVEIGVTAAALSPRIEDVGKVGVPDDAVAIHVAKA
jgi:hypothetical protein